MSRTADPARIKLAQARIDKILHEAKVSEFIQEQEYISEIRNGLADQLEKHPNADHFVGEVRSALESRVKAAKRLKNQEIRELKLRKRAIDPASTFDVEKLLPVLREKSLSEYYEIGKSEESSRYYSILGENQREIDQVLDSPGPDVFLEPPSKTYQNLVIDSKKKAEKEAKVANANIRSLMDSGRLLTKEEESVYGVENRKLERTKNALEFFGHGVQKFAGSALRGMLKDSKATEDSRAAQYAQLRNELLARVMMKIGPGMKDNTFYLRALKRVNDALGTSGDILDHETFVRMQKLISDEIEAEGKVNAEEMEKMNKSLQGLEREMLKDLQGLVDKEDQMWKGRLLQMFLLLTPLGAFSAIGLTSYMGFFTDLLGPLFDGALSVGEGLGKIASSDSINIGKKIFGEDNFLGQYFLNFGDYIRYAHIDEAIEFLVDETPVIKDVTGVVDTLTDSEIFQEGKGLASPLSGAPILEIGAAVIYSAWRLPGEVDHYLDNDPKSKDNSVKKFKEKSSTKLESAINEAVANIDKNTTGEALKKRLTAFDAKKLQIEKEINLCGELAKFIVEVVSAKDGREKIFDGIKFRTKDASGTESVKLFSELDLGHESKAVTLLAKDAAFQDACMKQFLLFSAVKKDGESTEEILKKFNLDRSEDQKAKLRSEKQKVFDDACVVKLAEKASEKDGFILPNPPKDLEKKLVEFRLEKLYRMANNRNPDPVPSAKITDPSASSVLRGPLYPQSNQGCAAAA